MRMKIDDVFNVDDIVLTNNTFLFEPLLLAVKQVCTDSGVEFVDTPFEKLLTMVKDLNTGYFIEHSNQKYISPMFERFIKIKEEHSYNDTWLFEQLSKIIALKYGISWTKTYNALLTDYKPLENYSMTEHREHDNTVKNNTDMKTIVHGDNGIFGFNSGGTSSNPTNDNDGTTTVTGDGDKNTQNDKGNEDTTRSGNIGVTTSQQMLDSEIKLRQFNFINQMFVDIDKILCLSMY